MLRVDRVKLAYVAPPKTGTHTVRATLNERYAADCVGHDVSHSLTRDDLEAYKDYHWVVSCRNPFSRAVSLWRHVKNMVPGSQAGPARIRIFELAQRLSFAQWTEARLEAQPDATLTYHYLRKLDRVDHFIRTEAMTDDLNAVFAAIGEPQLTEPVGVHFQGNHTTEPWWVEYEEDASAAPLVLQIYDADFDNLKQFYTRSVEDAVAADNAIDRSKQVNPAANHPRVLGKLTTTE